MQVQDYGYSEDFDVFFQDQGLSIDIIKAAISYAMSEYANTTSNDVATFRGYTISANVVRKLRDILAHKGFKKESIQNVELTIFNNFAIHVARGDEQTGLKDGHPGSCRAKGEVSRKVLGLKVADINQIDMFDEHLPKYDTNHLDLWILLLFPEKDTNGDLKKIRVELSKPLSISQNGFINSFSPRFIIDCEEQLIKDNVVDNIDDNFSDDIDIDISVNE